MGKNKVAFRKTAKGIEEVEKRSVGLAPRARRLLILVDGKRTVEALREMVAADDLSHSLGMLEEEGFIEVAALVDPAGAIVAAPAEALSSITAYRDDPPPDDAMRLQMSRNFMENTIKAFMGTVGMSGLLERIDRAASLAALRGCFDDWYQAIVSSRDGRRQAEALRAKLLETI